MSIGITFDSVEIDLDAVFDFLHNEAYWSKGRPRDVFDRSIEGSALVVGAVDEAGRTVGFVRVVSDTATFAWFCDVYVAPEARGSGVGKLLVEAAIGHESVAGVKRHLLATADAHGLYEQFGFSSLDEPHHWMTRTPPKG